MITMSLCKTVYLRLKYKYARFNVKNYFVQQYYDYHKPCESVTPT